VARDKAKMIGKAFAIFTLVFLIGTISVAQSADQASVKNDALRRELIKLGKEDQKYRGELEKLAMKLSGPNQKEATEKFIAVVKKQDEIDAQNIKRLEEIIAQYGWPGRSLVGKEASQAAFLIIQHAELNYQKKYFARLKEAAAKDEARASEVAMLEDRILMREGKKQLYGTQVRTNDVTKKLELYVIEDEENVDARRAAVGLPPIAEYLKHFGLTYTPPKKN
jgi:hypothetical protein